MRRIIRKIVIINTIMLIIGMFCLQGINISSAANHTQTVTSGISSFPESYQTLLNDFVTQTGHTNWTFKAYYTGIDWADLVANESVCEVNRVASSFDTAHRCSCGNLASGYYCASAEITSYFMDPRNFINERNIFQFSETSYDSSIHTRDVVHSLVSKYAIFNYGNNVTFTKSKGDCATVTMSYTDIIMEAASISQMSPISMVVKIVQEIGGSGSDSVSGTYSGYEGLYNFFNIGASDSGNAIVNGLEYAKSQGWYCPYYSIVEGATFNSKYYIQAGQNTAYFYKYDVVGSTILNVGESQTVSSSLFYNHQYMTNVSDPYTQSATLYSTYSSEGFLDKNLTFVIPVYDNMPSKVYKPSSLSNSTQNLYYVNITATANVRSGPGTGYSVSGSVSKDDLVIVLQENAGTANGYVWSKVQLWNSTIGYIASDFISEFTKEDVTTTQPENTDILTNIGYGYANVSISLNVRSGPGTSYSVVKSLYPLEEATIISETSDWYYIKTNTGSNDCYGYVSKSYFNTFDAVKKEGTTITVTPKITADIVAGDLGITDYTVTKDGTNITNYELGTGYKMTFGGVEYEIIKQGDVNGDGTVNTIDALVVQRHVLEYVTHVGNYLKAADANNDGVVNTVDALVIQRYVLAYMQINI